jgi:hypothetical protein
MILLLLSKYVKHSTCALINSLTDILMELLFQATEVDFELDYQVSQRLLES